VCSNAGRRLRPACPGFKRPAAALLTSRLLLLAGVQSLMVCYALAAVGGYLVFFILVRGWIAYVAGVGPRDPGLGGRYSIIPTRTETPRTQRKCT